MPKGSSTAGDPATAQQRYLAAGSQGAPEQGTPDAPLASTADPPQTWPGMDSRQVSRIACL